MLRFLMQFLEQFRPVLDKVPFVEPDHQTSPFTLDQRQDRQILLFKRDC